MLIFKENSVLSLRRGECQVTSPLSGKIGIGCHILTLPKVTSPSLRHFLEVCSPVYKSFCSHIDRNIISKTKVSIYQSLYFLMMGHGAFTQTYYLISKTLL